MNEVKLKELIAAGDLSEIFIGHLGWDNADTSTIKLPVTFEEETSTFNIEIVAQKRGFAVCSVICNEMPSKLMQQKLERALTRIHYEHLLVLRANDGRQTWMVSRKLPGKPIRVLELSLNAGQPSDILLEKLKKLVFKLRDEKRLNIEDVTDLVTNTFTQNAETVTRNFYECFRRELKEFQEFISGLTKQVDKEQYASLMLNRLMFIYFIQKKKFLDDDYDYLKNRLEQVQAKRGRNEFYKGFYRHFLITLFHRGLGAPEEERTAEVQELIGEVPYLNGGLFDESALEKQYGDALDIDDSAFEKIFTFFDRYQWYLDDRPTTTQTSINPDVIGYIFEKYINDRSQKGAYYTQEDITGYIARNTVLPYLLRQAKKNCAVAFNAQNGTIWKLLRDDPDHYIYDAAKHGCPITNDELPPHIAAGLDADTPDLLQRRATWNTVVDNEELALPAETWREMIARRARYTALRNKISNGEITDIADLITYNLDIEKLTNDFLSTHEGADLIAAFYAAVAGREKVEGLPGASVRGITVLDPACGSGAFLFAALNVLEPLYEKCIHRMREFVDDDDSSYKNKKRKGMKKHQHFRTVLAELEQHKNERYWIYRNIILRNLFGVDIMPEAVEVAKLRLFLKLAAEAEMDKAKDNMGLEPLPDIDFNIRAGNALVGVANFVDFKNKIKKELDLSDGVIDEVRKTAERVGMAYTHFVKTQTISDINSKDFKDAKEELKNKLNELNAKLSEYLAGNYGKKSPSQIAEWQKTHLPFHWFSEFYGIVENGGFDVVIGNPPYVTYTETRKTPDTMKSSVGYFIDEQYETKSARDLYAFVVERGMSLLSSDGDFGMIVPISITTSNRCQSLRNLFNDRRVWTATFADRPNSLFVGVHQMLTTVIASRFRKMQINTTGFKHWYQNERDTLFETISYHPSLIVEGAWGKFSNETEIHIADKIAGNNSSLGHYITPNGNGIVAVCSGTGGYYLRAFNERQESSEYKILHTDANKAASIAGIINSNIFFWFWRKFSNCRHLRTTDRNRFRIHFTDDLMADMNAPSREAVAALTTTKEFRGGNIAYFQYRPARVKHYFDEIDKVLAKHYGLTDEELDYIINYDYKYRMSGA